jgi:DNA-binding transcriptional regulator YiaG
MTLTGRKKSSPKGRGKMQLPAPAAKSSAGIADFRKGLNLSQPVFARLLPLSVRSLATLESGSPPTEVVTRRLKELKRLVNALSEVMKMDSIGIWLQTPNEAFDELKPLEVIDRGEIDRLWSMIFSLRSGVPS